jgi:hypothetical protein
MKKVLLVIVLVLGGAWAAISIIVQVEGAYVHEELGTGKGARGKALILYHPSRDAHFAEDLTLALAQGLSESGFAVSRATMTAKTPAHPEGYAIVAVVSNTYYSAPDKPTMHYLERARFDGMTAIGLIGGAGSTARAERLLDEALHHTNARVLGTRHFWIMRPNDEKRMAEPNRDVARDLARRFGAETGAAMPTIPLGGDRSLAAGAPR